MASEEVREKHEERSNFFRLTTLLLDEGLAVLRHIFDNYHPPQDLQTHLKNVQQDLQQYYSKKALNIDQWDVLYPQHGGTVSSKDFDITLLTFLLTFPRGLQHLPAGWMYLPPSMTKNLEDLRTYRNKIFAHARSASVPLQEFNVLWADISKLLLKTGVGIPKLHSRISNLRSKSPDQALEVEYMDALRKWNEKDNQLDDMKRKLAELEDETVSQRKVVLTLEHNIENVTDKLQEQSRNTVTQQSRIEELSLQHKSLRTEQQEKTRTTDNTLEQIKTMVASLQGLQTSTAQNSALEIRKREDPILHSLCGKTEVALTNYEQRRNVFVQTTIYRKAEELLKQKRILVLSGNPGEGKTTTAVHIALRNFSPDRCLIIREPADWRHVDPKLFQVIIIDDIFGRGHLNSSWLQEWRPRFDIMHSISRICDVSFIITSRLHILQESRSALRSVRMFSDEYVQNISSVSLLAEEKLLILEKHLDDSGIKRTTQFVDECVKSHKSVLGFPECAELFTIEYGQFGNFVADEIGSQFFARPLQFLRKCLSELQSEFEYEFFALVLVWASKPFGCLYRQELDPNSPSNYVVRTASMCGWKMDAGSLKRLRNALHSFRNGFLVFNEREGSYQMRQKSVGDAVGLLFCEQFPEEALQICSMEFIMEFVVLDASKAESEFVFEVPQYLYPALVDRFLDRMKGWEPHLELGQASQFGIFAQLAIMQKVAGDYFHDTFAIAKHSCLHSHNFVSCLLDKVESKELHTFLLTTLDPVGNRWGIQQKYALKTFYNLSLLPYCLYMDDKKETFVKEVLERKLLEKLPNQALAKEIKQWCLFFALSRRCDTIVKLLVEPEVVDNDCIRAAIVKGGFKNFKLLVERGRVKLDTDISDGNTPLIIAVKHGKIDIVRYIVRKGRNLSSKNKKDVSALDRAILNGHEDIAKILIEKGVNIHAKSGRRKKSALHLAVDFNLNKTVSLLLSKGASPRVKDLKGHTPLHYASMKGKDEIVKLLLQKDSGSVNTKAYSYATKSKVKGTTPLHYAVRHNHQKVVDILLDNGARVDIVNCLGQSPVHTASAYGNVYALQKMEPNSDLDLPDDRGFTPFQTAVYNNQTAVVEFFMGKVDINRKDKKGRTALHVAAQRGYSEVVGILLKQGIDYQSLTIREDLALHYACRQGYVQAAKILFQMDIESAFRRNKQDKSPLMEAKWCEHALILEMMTNYVKEEYESETSKLIEFTRRLEHELKFVSTKSKHASKGGSK